MTIGKKIVIGVDGMGRPRRVLDERGRIYGRLRVIRLSKKHSHRSNAQWVCKCRCGRQTVVGGAQLRIGNTTSCGCYWDEIRKSGCNRLPTNEAAFNRAYGKVRDGATKRGLLWAINKYEARVLLSSPCHYCGSPPALIQAGENGSFTWNGLDQKQPNGGYTLENCVPCCTQCNRMKMSIPYAEFINKCKRIAARFEPMAKQSESMKRMR